MTAVAVAVAVALAAVPAGGATLPTPQPDPGEPQTIVYGSQDGSDTALLLRRASDGRRVCSAALIAPTWALTAAHCVDRDGTQLTPADIEVVAGSEAVAVAVASIVVHPTWDGVHLSRTVDLALIELAEAVTWPVLNVVDTATERQLIADRAVTRVSGYGVTEGLNDNPTEPRFAVMRLDSARTCLDRFVGFDDANFLCGVELDGSDARSCSGDSGGPVTADVAGQQRLIGVSSFGVSGCTADAPVGWSRVASATGWIDEVTGLNILTTDAGSTPGYWLLADQGQVYSFGSATYAGGRNLADAVDLIADPDGDGYWLLWSDGGFEAHSAAELPEVIFPAVYPGPQFAAGGAAPDGQGLALFGVDGAVSVVGSMQWHGDVFGIDLAAPIVDGAATPSGDGYWMVAADGGVFAFGDARFHGSLPGLVGPAGLAADVVSMVATSTGDGYWLVGADGGVFAFGDARFAGSVPGVLAPGQSLNQPVVDMAAYGNGYLLVASDGGTFTFSDQPFLGSLARSGLARPIVAIETVPSGPAASSGATP